MRRCDNHHHGPQSCVVAICHFNLVVYEGQTEHRNALDFFEMVNAAESGPVLDPENGKVKSMESLWLNRV